MQFARIGVLVEKAAASKRWSYGINIFDRFIGEVLSDKGISFDWLDSAERISHYTLDVVIVASANDDERTLQLLNSFMEKGGSVITYGGLNFMARHLGYRVQATVPVGYAELPAENGEERPLRFIGAAPWVRKREDAAICTEKGHIKENSPDSSAAGALLQQFEIGEGRLERWSVQAVSTIVHIQQGRDPIFEDGSPPDDGSAVIDEGLLKADDGVAQDYRWDRKVSETGAVYFAHPYADLWREALIKHLVGCVLRVQLTIPMLAPWPEGTEHVAMISHDSDWSSDEAGQTTLDVLEECGIRSTWCMIQTGYSGQVHDRILKQGHELAMHYNAMKDQGGMWSREDFHRQYRWLSENLPGDALYSNKNHYTRFEGWGELFEWCEQCGIAVDQSRGPSKKGNVGFLFGTCKPYFPIAWANDKNRFYDVVEIGFLTQDIPAWTDMSVVQPFLKEVKQIHGVAHFLFHQGRIHRNEEVRESLKQVIENIKAHGFSFWTSKEIGEWVRLRRRINITGVDEAGISFQSSEAFPPVKVRIPITPAEWDATDVANSPYRLVEHMGLPCLEMTISNRKEKTNA